MRLPDEEEGGWQGQRRKGHSKEEMERRLPDEEEGGWQGQRRKGHSKEETEKRSDES